MRGNPLAIQAILPELKRTGPDALLEALRAGELKLSDDDPLLGRERSLSASLSYRLDALDSMLRRRLGVLALFQGFLDADVVAHMCNSVDGAPDEIRGLKREDWIRILDSAAEVGLLREAGEGHYTVHPALPWFFHDLLRESFPDHGEWTEVSVASAYGSYGVYLMKMFQTNAQLAMGLLNSEEGNLMQALRLARRHEECESVEGILYGLNKLFTTQGRWVEWERLAGEIESEASSSDGEPLPGGESLWTALLGHRAEIAQYRRDFDASKSILLRLKAHYEREGDDRNHAAALHQLGMIAQERRQLDEAERWYRQSLEIKERIGDEHGQAITLHQLGMIAQERRRLDEAERWYRQSLAIEERIGDEHGQAQTLHQLGMIAEKQGNLAGAARLYEHAEGIFTRLNDPHSLEIARRALQRVRSRSDITTNE